MLRSANFYFTDVSEPSHTSFIRSVFILPTSQNRHSSSFSEELPAQLQEITILHEFLVHTLDISDSQYRTVVLVVWVLSAIAFVEVNL